jgi:hypothetical protein
MENKNQHPKDGSGIPDWLAETSAKQGKGLPDWLAIKEQKDIPGPVGLPIDDHQAVERSRSASARFLLVFFLLLLILVTTLLVVTLLFRN